jgi:asparagine synthase (glutamine-hydrolysing)
MCGIAGVFTRHTDQELLGSSDQLLISMLGQIRHRGDTYHFAERISFDGGAMGTNRLAIVDRQHARQPYTDESLGLHIVMNGEIYNHQELRHKLQELGHDFSTESDTEVVLRAFVEWKHMALEKLNGIFGFVIYDSKRKSIFAGRDHIGIKPLYFSDLCDVTAFGSERKCFLGLNCEVSEVLPGHYWLDGKQYMYKQFAAAPAEQDAEHAIARCRMLLDAAVRRQVATDLPIAVVFSGGLDSTIILHLATKYHADVTAFSLGTDTSSDLEFARQFCQEYSIPHRVIPFQLDRIPRSITNAIFNGELFEPVDISDMVAMSAIFAAIRSEGFKIALSGDGSDEIFAGYDLFKSAKDPYALTSYRVNNLYRTDLQRVDRSSMSNTVECRVPFLDRDLMDFALTLPIDLKIRKNVEKYVLREAFRTELPAYMVDRPKIRMPEGIGIRDSVFSAISDLPTIEHKNSMNGILIDSDQIANAISYYTAFGFPQPQNRFKQSGLDYHSGGYFEFSSEVVTP